MRGHAGRYWVAGHHTGWHWGGRPVVADPGWVLNLGRGERERKVTGVLWGERGAHRCLVPLPGMSLYS